MDKNPVGPNLSKDITLLNFANLKRRYNFYNNFGENNIAYLYIGTMDIFHQIYKSLNFNLLVKCIINIWLRFYKWNDYVNCIVCSTCLNSPLIASINKSVGGYGHKNYLLTDIGYRRKYNTFISGTGQQIVYSHFAF